MKSKEEIRQYIKGIEINRGLAFINDEIDMVREYDTQINILKWVIDTSDIDVFIGSEVESDIELKGE